MSRPAFDVGVARPDEIAAAAEVLQEAARWIMTWRAQLWDPALLGEAFVAPLVAQGEMLVARDGDSLAGVVVLQPEDRHFWPDRPQGEAGYVHKLAVRRAYAGTGLSKVLIDHAAETSKRQGRRFLRLDCDPPLAGFYEGLGFRGVDQIDVDHPEAGPMRVARMERALD